MTSVTLRQHAYQHIRRKVLENHWQDGQRLSEVAIAKEIGISRTPVREALGQLTSEGLLDRVHYGVVVRRITRDEMDEMLRLRILLEPYAAARAATRATDQHIEQLREAIDQLRTISRRIRDNKHKSLQAEDARRLTVTDLVFHSIILDVADSSKVKKIIADYRLLTTRYRDQNALKASSLARVLWEHWRIYRAISRRDPRAARQTMRIAAINGRRGQLNSFDRAQRQTKNSSVYDWTAALQRVLSDDLQQAADQSSRRPRRVTRRKKPGKKPEALPGGLPGGFTLIELLVVMAIVTVLTSMLLPSINEARELSRIAVCMSNLRQFSTSAHGYVADNAGWWVVGGVMGGSGRGPGVINKSPLWTYVLSYRMGVFYASEHNDYKGVAPFYYPERTHGQKDNGIFQCPSDDVLNFWGGNNACSYGWNASWNYGWGMGFSDWEDMGQGVYPGINNMRGNKVVGADKDLGRTRQAWVTKPRTTFVITDTISSLKVTFYEEALTRITSTDFPQPTDPTTNRMADVHLDSGNYLWVDGHVNRLKPQDVTLDHFDRRK